MTKKKNLATIGETKPNANLNLIDYGIGQTKPNQISLNIYKKHLID